MEPNPTTLKTPPPETKDAPAVPLPKDRQELVRYYRQGWDLAKTGEKLELDDEAIDARLRTKGAVDTSAAERTGKEDAQTVAPFLGLKDKAPLPKDAPPTPKN